MPTAYADQFFTMDPASPPAAGTLLVFQRVEFIDADDDGNIGSGTGDTWNGNTVSQVWENDTVTINVPGVGNVTYTGVTFYFTNGDPPVFTPTDGQVLENGTFVSSTFVTTATQTPVGSLGPTCFTPGTMIDTPIGPRAIERIRSGDLVLTMDHGAQPVQHVLDRSLRAIGDMAPIRFDTGAIGNRAPLIVSPQHRVLITGWQAELFYGQQEVLVAAKHLINNTNVRRVEGGMVRYLHLLFDRHQIVWGQGVPSESYYPAHGDALNDPLLEAELFRLFPQLAPAPKSARFVRPSVGRREAAVIAA
ncbi:MAG: Hint domain-containing protein [Pseudomonadota bacterium]